MPIHAPEADAPLTIISNTIDAVSSPAAAGAHDGELDNEGSGPFEGPEKLLEIWFAPTAEDVQARGLPERGGRQRAAGEAGGAYFGLRQVERAVWEEMLDVVQCKVLSVIEGEEVDAYLLSESSMFVWPHKLILKTCGTTTLLLGLPKLLSIALDICSLRNVWRCFYSRKTFMFPDKQKGPHRDWKDEMGFLDNLFDNSSAYTVGKMNGDHWLLYLTPPQEDEAHPSTPLETLSTILPALPRSLSPSSPSPPDQTLEILMSRLHPSACAEFYHPSSFTSSSTAELKYTSTPYAPPANANPLDSHVLGAQLSKRLGLRGLLPNATEDCFLFSPCGYSSNSVQGDRYATIHVTPEVDFSYASFETNLTFGTATPAVAVSANGGEGEENLVEGGPKSMTELVERVLEIFKPAKLSITLFVSSEQSAHHKKGGNGGMSELLNDELLEKYGLVDKIVYEFIGYSLVYAVYELC